MKVGKILSELAVSKENETAVIGVRDAKLQGNILHAFVVPAPNAPLGETDIRELKNLAGGSND